ncbi:hypothetical protein LWC33_20515 [Pseudonocardia sp. RS11V-5]|uniref:hypothetical protein n=1 Tax=Pseudonocardia terrae TaxID=2905831 RepID=UPI001E317C4E|nr:hypothetical protein [Pseudonocardia terrae]MCE3553827.1 hypothetical protein [Pseudonocardia terrae]
MLSIRSVLGGLVATSLAAGLVVGAEAGSDTAAPTTEPVPVCAEVGPYTPPPPNSVGTPAGVRLCPVRAALEVRTPGTVLDGLDVTGGVVVAAPGVVVRRSRVTGDGTTAAGIRTLDGGSVRIEDTTLTGAFTDAAVDGPDWVVERVEMTAVRADGARLGPGATLRNSWLHDFAPRSDRPVDAIALAAPEGDVLVEANRIRLGTGPGLGSAVLVDPAGTARHESAGDHERRVERPGPVVIRDNELGGGRYTLLRDAAAAPLADLRITGNRFHRDAGAAPLRVRGAAELRDNVFVDGGEVRR